MVGAKGLDFPKESGAPGRSTPWRRHHRVRRHAVRAGGLLRRSRTRQGHPLRERGIEAMSGQERAGGARAAVGRREGEGGSATGDTGSAAVTSQPATRTDPSGLACSPVKKWQTGQSSVRS